MIKSKRVTPGDWRTLESFWNATGHAWFALPAGAEIKVRYGYGWLGKDRQKQRLDGRTIKLLSVGRFSVAYARFQVKVQQTVDIAYDVRPGGPTEDAPPGGTLGIPGSF